MNLDTIDRCLIFSRQHGHPDGAVVEVEQIKNVWLFQFVWVLFGISVVSGLMTGADHVKLAQTFANNVTFFSIYLSIQVCISFSFVRVHPTSPPQHQRPYAAGPPHVAASPPPPYGHLMATSPSRPVLLFFSLLCLIHACVPCVCRLAWGSRSAR